MNRKDFGPAQRAFADVHGRFEAARAIAVLREPPQKLATTGSVLISANVAGAEVVVRRERIQTRAQGVEVEPLNPGRYPVKATREGYKEWTGQVDVVAGGRAELAIALERVPTAEVPPTTGSTPPSRKGPRPPPPPF